MLQRQMPVWVSHSLPDPCQEEDGKCLATCALKVRVTMLGNWGWTLKARETWLGGEG
jgi:hypothetical protein